jgi:hypothetical protein
MGFVGVDRRQVVESVTRSSRQWSMIVTFGRLRRDFRLSHFCAPAITRKTATLHLTSSP